MSQKKKSPAPGRTGRGSKSKNSKSNIKTLSPRLQRLCKALLKKPCTVRELIGRIPTNHPPQYIATLRHSYGLIIPCETVKFVTVDGVKSWHGKYHLTLKDKQKAKRLIGAG